MICMHEWYLYMKDKLINGIYVNVYVVDRDSPVDIVTRYGLDGPGIESDGARFSPPIKTCFGAHPASYTMGTGSSQGVVLTTNPHLAPRLKKGQSYTSTPPLGLHGLL